MGEDDDIELSHPAMPEVRCNYPLSYIESIIDAPAAIDQHGQPARKRQEYRIPLPYIEKRSLDPAPVRRKKLPADLPHKEHGCHAEHKPPSPHPREEDQT
jgi:hypothetical protein